MISRVCADAMLTPHLPPCRPKRMHTSAVLSADPALNHFRPISTLRCLPRAERNEDP
ncbi:MAG: hypothetical protein Q8Q09_01350 [Deltaproteobacteria bacterium]|nr:hypothetical protein [Deltaproteobacteria bacterium]